MSTATLCSLVFLFVIVLFIPFEYIIPKRNLGKLLKILNENIEKKQNVGDKFIYGISIICEKLPKRLNIRLKPERSERYRTMLILSGILDRISVECFVGMKIFASFLVFLFYFIIFVFSGFRANTFLTSIIMTCAGYYIPDSIVNGKIRKRQWKLQTELPNILNTLAIVTDSGLGLFEAIKKICDIRKGELINELKKVIDEIDIGMLQRDALYRMSDRCRVNDISVFTFTLVQSMEKGASGVTKILKDLSKEVWEKRKNSARELGEKASIKLFIPMMLLVFPCLLIFLIGPALISIIRIFR